jgi:hypothetical protein
MKPPANCYRIIRKCVCRRVHTHYYSTRDMRDAQAARWADIDQNDVILEFWHPDHNQDRLNRGWACDGVQSPQPRRTAIVNDTEGA